MHLTDTAKVVDDLMPVEHRRELNHYRTGFLKKHVAKFDDIRCAVLQCIGARAVQIAASRVEINKINRFHCAKKVYAVAAYNVGMMQSEHLEVTSCDITQISQTLDISGRAERAGKKGKVDTEPTGEVGH